MSNPSHIITAIVRNHSGVLTRVSGLFARRGYNIDSLSVCATEDPTLSRMTIVATGDDATIEQIVKQLNKLPDTVKISRLKEDNGIIRELLLVKISLAPARRPEIESACNIYKAKTVDLSVNSAVLELTGDPQKIDAFVELMVPYGIIELVRTGLTAIERK